MSAALSEIKLNVIYPLHPVVKKYVDYYYVLNPAKECVDCSYTAYPNINQPVIFFEHTKVAIKPGHHYLKYDEKAPAFCGVLNRFIEPLEVVIMGRVRTINIIFKSIGLNAFLKAPYNVIAKYPFQKFNGWDTPASFISSLFSLSNNRLAQSLDQLLLENYKPFENEYLDRALHLMFDNEGIAIKEMEYQLGVSRKTLLRIFKTNTGISPTSFRRVVRFRQALENNKCQKLNLTELAYMANFSDQSHFIKDVQKLTKDKPSSFLKTAGYVNGSNLLIKQHL